MRNTKYKCIAAAFAAAALTLAPSSALAGTEFYLVNATLTAGKAWATTSVHSQVNYVQSVSNHTSCPALASGYAGLTSSPNGGGNHTYISATTPPCATYGTTWEPNPSSTNLHGAALNPNNSTTDVFDDCWYRWN